MSIRKGTTLMRKRYAEQKVYVPTNARENQYLLAEFDVTPALLKQFSIEADHASLYAKLSQVVFNLCDNAGVDSCQFIANNKTPMVAFSEHQDVIESLERVLVLHNPGCHSGYFRHYDNDVKAEKISLLFLATGLNLRQNALAFHQQVIAVLKMLQGKLGESVDKIRIRDHQHLTFNLFAHHQGHSGSKAHQFRAIDKKYAQQDLNLPGSTRTMNYAVVTLPLHLGLESKVDIDLTAQDPYNPLYTWVADQVIKETRHYNLNNGALLADGRIPIVRHAAQASLYAHKETLHLGFNPQLSGGGFVCRWDSKKRVNEIRLLFMACESDRGRQGYGRFVNQVAKAVSEIARNLDVNAERDPLICRFHQHLSYDAV